MGALAHQGIPAGNTAGGYSAYAACRRPRNRSKLYVYRFLADLGGFGHYFRGGFVNLTISHMLVRFIRFDTFSHIFERFRKFLHAFRMFSDVFACFVTFRVFSDVFARVFFDLS